MPDFDKISTKAPTIFCPECHDAGTLWKIVISAAGDGWKHKKFAVPCICSTAKFRHGEEARNSYGKRREALIMNALEVQIMETIIRTGDAPESSMEYARLGGTDIRELRSIALKLRGDRDDT